MKKPGEVERVIIFLKYFCAGWVPRVRLQSPAIKSVCREKQLTLTNSVFDSIRFFFVFKLQNLQNHNVHKFWKINSTHLKPILTKAEVIRQRLCNETILYMPPPSVPRTPTEAGSAKWKFLEFLKGQPFSSPAHWGTNLLWDHSVGQRANVNWGEPFQQQKQPTRTGHCTPFASGQRNKVTIMMKNLNLDKFNHRRYSGLFLNCVYNKLNLCSWLHFYSIYKVKLHWCIL